MGLAPKGLVWGGLGFPVSTNPHPSGETRQMPGMPFTVIFILHGKPWEHSKDKAFLPPARGTDIGQRGPFGEVEPAKFDCVPGTTVSRVARPGG